MGPALALLVILTGETAATAPATCNAPDILREARVCRPCGSENPRKISVIARRAQRLHELGRYQAAAEAYGRLLSGHRRNSTALWFNMATALRDAGRGFMDESMSAFKRVISLDPSDIQARAELGSFLALRGTHSRARRHLSAAIALHKQFDPDKIKKRQWKALRTRCETLLGDMAIDEGDAKTAGDHYKRALRWAHSPEAQSSAAFNIALSRLRLGRQRAALRGFKKSASVYDGGETQAHASFILRSDDIAGAVREAATEWYRRGSGAFYAHEYERAKNYFWLALKCNPFQLDALHKMGLVLLSVGASDDAAMRYWKRVESDANRIDENECKALIHDYGSCTRESTLLHKLEHDLEHAIYLKSIGVDRAIAVVDTIRPLLKRVQRLILKAAEESSGSSDPEEVKKEAMMLEYVFNPRDRVAIDDIWKRVWHVPSLTALSGPAVSHRLATSHIGHWYQQEQIIYIDNILSADALQQAYRLCSEGAHFHNIKPWGYLGAYLNDGFVHPILLRIARELAERLPAVFQKHNLAQLWAYKYTSELEGIGMHGDDAAVNVNIWLTPDESNLDSTRGGLVVYRRFPPEHMDFKTFNNYANGQRLKNYFDENDTVRVPYRANRAVIFNSHLWHQTDSFRFKKGYKDRRINLTLLYGNREDAPKHRSYDSTER